MEITWALFRDAFLEEKNPEYVHEKKEVEFLELKQGNGTAAEYAARFQELIKYCPHYNTMNAESMESASHYKSSNDGKGQYRGKPYDEKKKQKSGYGGKPSGRGASTPVKCYKCGVEGHCANECNMNFGNCFKCDKSDHKIVDCRVGLGVTCYNQKKDDRINALKGLKEEVAVTQ
ncbi:uncharacterized protein LOC131598140 [Vicia villosa]|uniref:uncharacterized protein LOC131598140 n=1 Tax=Vicia villosa TaxID=3911 RepID=UPI00273C5441|nr:uncharacterized protein LOC131598140 [Vicia villosa]